MPRQPKVSLGDDGLIHYEIPAGAHALWTGPITGVVVLPDGSQVDVTPGVVLADSKEHALAISDAIGRRYVSEGHPNHDSETPFFFTPSSATHNPDGTPREAFADVVHAHAGPDKDSSPRAVIDAALAAATKKKG